jgi:elongator complex protein 3
MRIQREIPREEIASGTKAGNLRQIVQEELNRRNLSCKCIRCREIGHKSKTFQESHGAILRRIDYDASGGHEVFLSFEGQNDDVLFGFLRLRIPSGDEYREEIRQQRAALVRELHVYGHVVPIGERGGPESSQHKGYGSRLLLEAESVAREFSRKKIVVIAAVGTREYYRKRGYLNDGPFVSRII